MSAVIKYIIAVISLSIIPTSYGASLLTNGSFEQGLNEWNVSGFQLMQSYTDRFSVTQNPTDGLNMLGATNTVSEISQTFLLTGPLTLLSFDRNLVDPVFPFDNLSAIAFFTTIEDTNNNIKLSKRFSKPLSSNTWETVNLDLNFINSNLVIGEQYKLSIYAFPDMVACIPEDPDPICGTPGTGTVLIDNVALSAVPIPSTLWLLTSGLIILFQSFTRRDTTV